MGCLNPMNVDNSGTALSRLFKLWNISLTVFLVGIVLWDRSKRTWGYGYKISADQFFLRVGGCHKGSCIVFMKWFIGVYSIIA